MAGDPDAKNNLQYAETRGHKKIPPRRGREQSGRAQGHQTKTHDRDEAHGERSTGDDRGAVQKQPNAGQSRKGAGVIQDESKQTADDDGRRETESELAAWSGEKSGVCAAGFGGRSGRGDGDGYERFDKPDDKPGAHGSLARSDSGSGESGDAHGDAAPTGNGGELDGALHGFADVAKMIGGASVDGDGLARNAECARERHREKIAGGVGPVKYFVL